MRRNPDGREIVADIEARIAELILNEQESDNVVSRALAESVVAQLGFPDDLDTEEEPPVEKIPKRLYRNPGRGGTRRRMLRTGCLFPYRPRMDKARILPADAAGHLSHGRRFGLFRFDVRHVRRPVHHSLDSHSHGADTAAETRNARRKSDCILHTADLRRGRLGHAALPEAPAVGIGLGGYRLWAGTHPALPAQSGSILHRTGRRHRSHRMFRRHHSRPVQRRTGSADGWYWKTSPGSMATPGLYAGLTLLRY